MPALTFVIPRRFVIVMIVMLLAPSAVDGCNPHLHSAFHGVCIYHRYLVCAIRYVELRKRRCSILIYGCPDVPIHAERQPAIR